MADAVRTVLDDLPPMAEFAAPPGVPLDAAFAEGRPFVARGYVRDWPLVRAGLESGQAARDYLLERHRDQPFVVSLGPSDADGRIFYNDDMSLNVRTGRSRLGEIFRRLAEEETKAAQEIIYLASIDLQTFFDGVDEAHPIALGDRSCLRSIWIGTRTRIAAHNDFPDNLACVAVGRRRFTLFPPEAFRHLYIGPVDNTPAGRAISMVDFHHPDFERYPDFAKALDMAVTADLEPGDAIFIPSMWWHHVEGRDPFNVLMNYWWRETPRYLGQPQDALNHAMMTIRDLSAHEKQHWRDLFDHYVFGDPETPRRHIPQGARSILDPMTPERANRIRSYLLRALNQ